MTIVSAIIFGLIQGICEFFPISSSAHLYLFQFFIHKKPDIFFDLILHLASLLAVIWVLRKTIINQYKENFFLFFLALLPLIPMYILYKFVLKNFLSIQYLGIFFLVSSMMLFTLHSIGNRKKTFSHPWMDGIFIGIMQALALFPGISRSGSTIWAAQKRNWPVQKAIRFSFLLAIPATIGGSFLESLLHLQDLSITLANNWPYYIGGFFSAFAMSVLGAKIIFSFTSYKQFLPFAWYCLIIGIATLIYMHVFV